MPLYEYKCNRCERHTEKRQKFSDPEITECPHCGGPLERVLSAPAISFKGSGWYKDLYSNPKPAVAASSGPAASTDAASAPATPAAAPASPPAAPSSAPAAPSSAPPKA